MPGAKKNQQKREQSRLTEIASGEGFVMQPRLFSSWPMGTISGFFEIKVQTASPTEAMMVYTRRKEICFMVEMNEGQNLPALHAKIAAYPAYNGRKAYFFAKHVDQGELFVSGLQMFARDW
jgi:hypothetical protein